MNVLRKKRWSPYLVGLLIGVLSWVTFLTMDKALGTSTTMVHGAGAVVAVASSEHLKSNPYYAAKINEKKPLFDWQFFLVLALPIGAYIAARLASDRHAEKVPDLWRWKFGASRVKRYVWAFIGGAVLLFGARLAGGCTSGHGISGGLQLAVSSWTFFAATFAAGIVTAFALFGKEGRNHV
jgi:hypothetical protein